MKLIGVPLSPYVRKVAVILSVKGLPYEQEIVIPGMQPEDFHLISPLKKIPVLQDAEEHIPDSSVICEYLEEKYPETTVLPATPELRARARFLEEYGDGKLMEVASIPFIENFAARFLLKREPDEARVKDAIDNLLPPVLDYVEANVPAEGFLFGHFTTADIALVSPMLNAEVGKYFVDSARWPKFSAFIDRVKLHPPVAKVLAAEQAFMASMAK